MCEQKITRRHIISSGNDPGESVLPVAYTSDQNNVEGTVPQSKYIVLLRIVIFTAAIFHFTYYISTWAPKYPKHMRQETETKGDPMMQTVSTVAEIESTLQIENIRVYGALKEDAKIRIQSLARTYALTYKLIRELQNQHINVTLTYGSHLGALRHHGVIPFEEKDVDLAVFSTDTSKIERAIRTTLATQPHLNLTFTESDFGFQIPATKELLTYIDVWMFKNDVSGNTTTCVGHQLPKKSCKTWYLNFKAKPPPIYKYDEWVPFRTQLFGTERVPIPATNIPIEISDFDDRGGPGLWNTTCGPHRRWNAERERWDEVDMIERKCEDKYDTYPFVFKKENGIEQLRQGSVVIHEVAGVSTLP